MGGPSMRSKMKLLIIVGFAVAGINLSAISPQWSEVLAQVGGYDSSFLGCITTSKGGFVSTLSTGPDAPDIVTHTSCADALNSTTYGCTISKETLAVDPKTGAFGALFRIECQ